MYAKKGNKIVDVTEVTKQSYLNQGFDIMDDDGNVVEYGRGASVPMAQYLELLEKYEALTKPETVEETVEAEKVEVVDEAVEEETEKETVEEKPKNNKKK